MHGLLEIADLSGPRAYDEVLAMQEDCVRRRKKGEIPDTLILVEHEPVYTLGRNADSAYIVGGEDELRRMGIAVARTTRGGEVTYHGPGQLVGYPILDLGEGSKGPVWYVERLEEVLIRTVGHFGIVGARDSRNRGVWVGNDKLAAIGVRISRHITMHGFALNVVTDLEHYRGIVPCGIAGAGVASMRSFVPDIRMEDVKAVLIREFCGVFGYAL